jgi:hypothetical protein
MKHIFKCAGCGCLVDSDRSDALTCSTACRVRAHRNGKIKRLREIAEMMDIPPGIIVQCQAITGLRPDLDDAIRDGKLTIKQAQQQIWPVYQDVVAAAALEADAVAA